MPNPPRKTTPRVLYKFRSVTVRDVECLLVDRQLYLSSPLTWNDPFDCYPVIAAPAEDLIEREIEKRIGELDPQLHEGFRQQMKIEMRKAEWLEELREKIYREALGTMGVVTFSASRNHSLLWAHYANNYRGFAVGYRARAKGDRKPVPAVAVNYSWDRPRFNVFGATEWRKLLASKSPHWRYEKEWRFLRPSEHGGVGTMAVPKGAIVEVCLGSRMDGAERAAVLRAARALPDKPRILQARLMPEKYGLHFDRVR